MTAAAIDKLIQQPPYHSLGFILAGGSSRRMGSDKAQLKVGQQTMLDARQIKSMDEITLLNMSAAMVDGVYHTIAKI